MPRETTDFKPEKQISGGIRNDSAPTTYDGEPASLRLDSDSALVVSMTGVIGDGVNTIADDFDDEAQTWANVTDVSGAQVYPVAGYYEIENRNNLGFHIRMRDGVFDIQVSNNGTNWITATKMVTDVSEGGNGFDNTHYSEADVQVDDFGVAWEKCEFRYIRVLFTPNDATNTFIALVRARAH